MIQVFEENSKGNGDNQETDICVKFEFEILNKSKNLSIYQANCMRKINEIKKFTKENRYYIDYYNDQRIKLELEAKQEKSDDEEAITKTESVDTKNDQIKVFTSTFTSALCFYNDKNEHIQSELKVKQETEEYKPEKKDNPQIIEIKSEIKQEVKIESYSKDSPIAKIQPKEAVINSSITKIELKQEPQSTQIGLSEISLIVVTGLSKVYKQGKFLNKVFIYKLFEMKPLNLLKKVLKNRTFLNW